MTKLRLMMKLIAGALVIFAHPAQAAKQSTTFKLSLEASPAGIAANTPTAVTLTPTATPLKAMPTKEPRMETAKPVETHAAAPTAHPPANVNIQLPDVHVSAGAETHTNTKETIIERTIEVKEPVAPAEPQNNNVLYLAIFGILALAIVAGLLMMRNKSDESDKKPPK